MIAPARRAAYEVLRAVGSGRADLPAALVRARAGLDDERDRALAGEIATGTLRWQAAFDHVVSSFTKRPVDKLDGEILDILRLTMFQILHLERVPVSAAVNDAVDLARASGKSSAAALVNAVLRRVSRERAHLPLPPRRADTRDDGVAYLSASLSHPRWLVERWLDRYGFDAAEAWCRFNNSPAALTIRANRLQTTREEIRERLGEYGVETEPARFAPDAMIVTRGNPLRTPLAGRGLFAVQDEASQLVAYAAAPDAGDRVLDTCAAPGGKTTAMAALMHGRGLIVSMDVRRKRVALLAETIRAAGAARAVVVQADAARPLPFDPVFDLVLIDAPCSGLGTVRRDPDIKWRRLESDLAGLADLQLRILRQAAEVVSPGGRLVYSTCSSEPEENDEVVEQFLAADRRFREVPIVLSGAPAELVGADGRFRTLPFRDRLEAFFAAAVVKAAELG